MATKGQTWRFYINDASGNEEQVGKTREKEVSQSKETLDASSDDNPDYGSYVGGLREGEVTISGLYSRSDSGQAALRDAFDSDTAREMALKGKNSGDEELIFSGHITELTRTYNTNELSVFDVTVQIDGDIEEGQV